MALVFVLASNLPQPGPLESESSHSAKIQLEKELAIRQPRPKITVSTEFGRSTQTLGRKEMVANMGDARPLQKSLAGYVQAHQELDLDGSELPKDSRWLIYTPGAVGWGNRLQGLYLSVAISLVTNRTLLVDWTSPVRLQELVSLKTHIPLILPEHLRPSLKKLPSRNVDAWLHPNSYKNFPIDILQGEDITKWEETVVHFSAGEDWLNHLLQNPHLRDDIQRVFGTYPEHEWSAKSLQLVAHELLDFVLLELSPAARSLFQRSAMAPLFDQASSLIGIQIRIGTNNTSFEPFVDIGKDVPKFWQCADSVLRSKPSSKVFLATDSAEVKELARKRFGERLLFFEGPIVHSGNEQLTDEKGQDRSIDGLLKVVVDWWLLGETQILFRSRQSTFGRTAAIRRPTPSLVLPSQFTEGCPFLH
jgi:hypothetical protein